MKKRLSLLLRLLVTLGLLALVFRNADLAALGTELSNVHLGWFLGAVGTSLFSVSMNVYRWGMLLKILGHAPGYGRLLTLQLYGIFFNNLLPTSIGGDAVRAYYTSHSPGSKGKIGLTDSVASIFVQRLTGFVVLISICTVAMMTLYTMLPEQAPPGLPILHPRSAAGVLVALFGGVVGIVAVVSFSRRAMNAISRLVHACRLGRVADNLSALAAKVRRFRGHPSAMLRVMAISALFHFIVAFSFFCMGRSVGIAEPFWYYLLAYPIITMAMMGPALGGAGLREVACTILFVSAGPEKALSLAILQLSTVVIAGSIGGLAFALSDVRRTAIEQWSETHESELSGAEIDSDDD